MKKGGVPWVNDEIARSGIDEIRFAAEFTESKQESDGNLHEYRQRTAEHLKVSPLFAEQSAEALRACNYALSLVGNRCYWRARSVPMARRRKAIFAAIARNVARTMSPQFETVGIATNSTQSGIPFASSSILSSNPAH